MEKEKGGKMKKTLEEQIIYLYRNNNIDNNLKENLLATLNRCSSEQLNRFEILLNNPTCLKNAASFSERQLALKEDKSDILERTLADETHAKSVFDCLVKKGFINGNDQKGYSVYNHYLDLNPDTLTDEEFVTFDCFFEMQIWKNFKNNEE